MKLEDCFEVGYVVRSHGLNGAVQVILDVDSPEKYAEMESVFIHLNGDLVPFFISSMQISGLKATVKFDGIDNRDLAETLRSCSLHLPLSLLQKLEENQFYYHEIIGYQVMDTALGKLGVVENVYSGGLQDLISMRYKDKEVLIPVTDATVLNADHSKQMLLVALPDGLLDIYL